MKDLIIVTAYCDKEEKTEILRNLVRQIHNQKDKFDLMVISHTTIPEDITRLTNFSIYDQKNELLYDWNLRSKPWFAPGSHRPILSIFTGFFNTHLAIWRMIIIANSVAKNCGYKKAHHIEYDCSILDFNELIENSKLLDLHDTITYNKREKDVDDIFFGTYQAYRLDTLHEELFVLNEEKIKQQILNSDTKSPESMLFNLLHNQKRGLVKDKSLLDENGNQFGLSHFDETKEHIAWCLPFFDYESEKLCFIVWNMEKKEQVNVNLIYNDEKVFNIENVKPGYWNVIDIDQFDSAKKLVVILNDKIRNIFDFTKNKEEFKLISYRR